MRKGTVVYFQCNDWIPYPEEAVRFIYNYLESEMYAENENSMFKTNKEVEKWIADNDLCINCDVYDQSIQYWVTTTKEWLEENFPELVKYANEVPEDDSFVDDHKMFLKYTEENIGLHSYDEVNYEEYREKFVD